MNDDHTSHEVAKLQKRVSVLEAEVIAWRVWWNALQHPALKLMANTVISHCEITDGLCPDIAQLARFDWEEPPPAKESTNGKG